MKVLEYRGGRGDVLMLTCVAHEWAKRGEEVAVITQNMQMLENNPGIKWVVPRESRYHRRFQRIVGNICHPNYLLNFDKANDTRDPLKEHVLIFMLRESGIRGDVELRPYFYIDEEKYPVGMIGDSLEDRYICLQSSGIGAQSYSPNKEWIHERMVEVVREMKREKTLTVQVGSLGDPVLGCHINLAGMTSLNLLGYVLSKARLFVGLEGMIMHMARAVECPSVIIYGGRLKPWQIGYEGNYAIVRECPEEKYSGLGCWRQQKCDYVNEHKHRACMEAISVEDVMLGIKTMLNQKREMPTMEAHIS